MTTLQDRVAALEAELAAVKQQLAAQDDLPVPPVPPIPTPPIEKPGFRIVELLDETSDLPTLDEMRRLFAAVKHLLPWPQARYDEDPDRLFRGFCSCFRWLQNQGRTERPNQKFDLSYWLDGCKTWLRQRNAVERDAKRIDPTYNLRKNRGTGR